MKLDKRVKEGKRPLTCFDLEESSGFLEKTGYFSNELDYFSDLSNANNCCSEFWRGKLLRIQENKRCVFKYLSIDGSREGSYRFFLPEDWVLPAEKKYRPYSLNEFLDEHEIGDKITFRLKLEEQPEDFARHKVMICGYQTVTGTANTPGEGFVNLGGTLVSLQHMFETYETPNSYLSPEVWEPFGVLDEQYINWICCISIICVGRIYFNIQIQK